ncbi:MAG TPA: N-acetyltransferase, partial [Anaerolineae bacterium]|nr:N-acetyltransferase [Anaerolineae bacterium]
RQIIDPDLALFAELEGQTVGFGISLPDINRALIHMNGRLFPLGWLQLWRHVVHCDVLTFKLMGVLPQLRFRGIDALLFVRSLQAMIAKGYQWLDGSLTSERNAMVNLLAGRLGAERYKHYRIYQTAT